MIVVLSAENKGNQTPVGISKQGNGSMFKDLMGLLTADQYPRMKVKINEEFKKFGWNNGYMGDPILHSDSASKIQVLKCQQWKLRNGNILKPTEELKHFIAQPTKRNSNLGRGTTRDKLEECACPAYSCAASIMCEDFCLTRTLM